MAYVTTTDLAPFIDVQALAPRRLEEMIADAEAFASAVAPCLAADDVTLSAAQAALVKAVLRGAVVRWIESGSGALQQQTAGPFSMTVDTRQRRFGMFTPDEESQLRAVCAAVSGGTEGSAFSFDTLSTDATTHLPWCTLTLGGLYCSCGADIAGVPIYEFG